MAVASKRLLCRVGSGSSSQKLITVLILCLSMASRNPSAVRQPRQAGETFPLAASRSHGAMRARSRKRNIIPVSPPSQHSRPFMDILQSADPEIWQTIADEARRQQDGLEMIASENYTSRAVME